MKYIILAVLALMSSHQKHVDPNVRIVEQRVVHPVDCENNPLQPVCTSVMTIFENLRYKPVEAVVSCGSSMDESYITLPPRTRLTVTIEITIYVEDPSCTMKSWQEK